MDEFAETLNIRRDETSSFFSLATQMSKQMGVYELEARQAYWILADHTAKVLIIAILVLITLLIFYTKSTNQCILIGVALAFYIFFMVRLFKIAYIERLKSNKNFIIFARDNREKIINGWKIKDK